MRTDDLHAVIHGLALLDATQDEVVSCYLDWRDQRNQDASSLAVLLDDAGIHTETKALILQYCRTADAGKHGLAIFVRQGEYPLFLALGFSRPLPTQIHHGPFPVIFPLVHLLDNYQRYLVLISQQANARILEVQLGEITREILLEHPEMRERVGREWTKLHYQNHQRERGLRFVREKIEVLEELLQEPDIGLVLAGDQRRISLVRSRLPKALQDKLIGMVPLARDGTTGEILDATIDACLAAERHTSRERVQEVMTSFHKDDMAVLGPADVLRALHLNQVDVLVIDLLRDQGQGVTCEDCHWTAAGEPHPTVCAECSSTKLKRIDLRQELLRQAMRQDCLVETIDGSAQLAPYQGVGCLLRYRLPSYEPSLN